MDDCEFFGMSGITTVGQLIDCLQQYDPNARLDVKVSWKDRNNYNCAHRDIWCHGKGIDVSIYIDDGVVVIENDDTEECCLYED